MKGKWYIVCLLILAVGFALASCKEETPVGELPMEQDEAKEGSDGNRQEGTKENAGQGEMPEKITGEVTLYLPNETADGFLTSSMILEDTPEAIIAQLVEDHALPEGVRVLEFDREQGILNLSEEFAEGLQRAGTSGELLYVGCVVNTFLEHYGLDTIMLYSAGEVIGTGHNTYEEPIGFVEWE